MVQPVNLSALPVHQLFAEQAVRTAALLAAKTGADEVKAELTRRFAASAKEALTQKGKTHGSITMPLQDGYSAKADAKQTVKWDSDALMAIAQTLPWDRVKALFKIDFSMSETIYKGIEAAAPELAARVEEARTTKIAEPTVSLTKDD